MSLCFKIISIIQGGLKKSWQTKLGIFLNGTPGIYLFKLAFLFISIKVEKMLTIQLFLK